MTAARRVLAVALMLFLTLFLMPVFVAPIASAHAGGLSPTASRSVVLSISPPVPGLSVVAIEDGARLRITNNTGSTVTIEPGNGQVQPISLPDGTTLSWIDPRTTTLEHDLGSATTQAWSLTMTVDAMPVIVTGEFIAEESPPALGWWAAAVGIAAATLFPARRTGRPDIVLACCGLVTVTISLVHVIGATLAVQSAPLWGTFLDATGIGLFVWPLVVVCAVSALRGYAAGVLGVCVGAGLSVVFIAPDITEFHYGVLPFEGPADLSRLLVAVVLGVGSATAAAGASALRTLAARQPLPQPRPESESST